MQPRINDPMRMVDKRGFPKKTFTPAVVPQTEEPPVTRRRREQISADEMPRNEAGIAPRTPGGRRVNKTYNTYI
jgi:hypothetical protein